ncbi:MAG: ATP-binding protein [archaeon]|nr:ATP-binding protein [archaeon]
MGDPSTAKSQFLKFVERAAPIAVYTSGKGSSAAGLTASIIKDASSGEFQLEGGAMVLADGGIVCIDEFDKMRAQDRVAIHEAMEQQTISVAKAGITTTLNSRTSVLAAANPIFGHIDDFKTTQEQIDFQTTILSRFDCIFLVRDVHNAEKDEKMAEHIVDINAAGKVGESTVEGEIPIADLKKYIAYTRERFTPKLTDDAAETLKNFYVKDRKDSNENKTKKGNDIPVTVRQLEAIVRLSEAIAKMSCSTTVNKNHVTEAHRLFQISTLYAAGPRTDVTFEIPKDAGREIVKLEEAIKRRIQVGKRVVYSKLIEDMGTKNTSERYIQYAVSNLVRTGVFKFSEEKKILTRIK